MFSWIIILLSGQSCAAQEQEIHAVINEYCEADYNGTLNFDKMDQLILGGYESGDATVVIDSYSIAKTVVMGDSAQVHVIYNIYGIQTGPIWVDADSTYYSDESWDYWRNVDFNMIYTDNGWKILSLYSPPHISPEALLSGLERIYKNYNFNPDDHLDLAMQSTMNTLKKIVSDRQRIQIPPAVIDPAVGDEEDTTLCLNSYKHMKRANNMFETYTINRNRFNKKRNRTQPE